MRHVRYCLCAGLLFGLCLPLATAEEKLPLSQEQLEAIAIQPASNWGSGAQRVLPEMLALFKEETIKFGGKTMKYRLHVPENFEEGKKYPMILWLHGAGEVGDDNRSQLIHLHHIIPSLVGERKRDFFLLVPQQPSYSHSWGVNADDFAHTAMTTGLSAEVKSGKKTLEAYKAELSKQMRDAYGPGTEVTVEETTVTVGVLRREGGVFGLGTKMVPEEKEETILTVSVKRTFESPLDFAFVMIEQAAEKYPVDMNRITVSGLSTGGDGTWRALERRPDLFAAGAPLANWVAFTDKGMEEFPILKKIPVWSIYSSDDNSIDRARAEFSRVEKAGANVKKTEFGICGHYAWTPAMLQADIFAWLLSRAKDGDRFYAVYDPGVDPDDMKGIVDVATRESGRPVLAPTTVEITPATDPFVLGRETNVPEEVKRIHVENVRRIDEARRAGIAQREARLAADQLEALRARQLGGEQAKKPGQIAQWGHPLIDPMAHAPSSERDAAYGAIAQAYLYVAQEKPEQREVALNAFKNCFKKISPKAQIELIPQIMPMAENVEILKMLEELLDDVPSGPPQPQQVPLYRPNPVIPAQAGIQTDDMNAVPLAPRLRGGDGAGGASLPVTISAEKIIEECDRPWAMTSESLYGMFAADWHKEAEAIPDFILNSDTNDLAKQLARSVGEDTESKDFVAACRSILLLQHKPMSSPWFETSGGRLQSEIQYSLSAKGQMFVRFLRTVKDSAGNSDKARELSKVAEKTLEKIDMVLEK